MGLQHDHSTVFPAISILVAILGSWTALDLFSRVRRHDGLVQTRWVLGAAAAMGVSIWSMHFIAMLGFDPGSPVAYDLTLTLLSLLLAVVGTAGAFWYFAKSMRSQSRLLVSGALMGLSIGGMHYLGMAALRTAVVLGYRLEWVVASVIVALGASTIALAVARRDTKAWWRVGASTLLGLGIVAMHYTAMIGLVLTRTQAHQRVEGLTPIWLAFGVAGITMLLLFLALGASLADQKQTLTLALTAGRLGYWELDIAKRRLTLSEQGRALLGFAPDSPFSQDQVSSLLTPESAANRARLLEKAIADCTDYEADYELRDGRWLEVRGQMLRTSAGECHRLVGTIQEVTFHRKSHQALVLAEARQRILINELNHRVKNTLATVLSIARLTSKQTDDPHVFFEAFEGRLMAMSATHNLLTASSWEQADIRDIFATELEAYGRERFMLTGQSVMLGSEQVLALGLIAHELATNAAKYGSLRKPQGNVDVSWETTEDTVVLRWTEIGGDQVVAPAKDGFGSRLIKSTARHGLGGYAEFDFGEKGLVFQLEIRRRMAVD